MSILLVSGLRPAGNVMQRATIAMVESHIERSDKIET
jgi:hypothetical protein